MKESVGWNGVIRFNDIKPVMPSELPPEQRAEHAVCSFANEFIDIFNTQPLSTRLACVAKLSAMVSMMALAAVAASVKKLPYVEPNKFDTIKDGKRLPLFLFTEEKP